MQQAKAIENTIQYVNTLLDYIATNLKGEIMHRKSDIKYKIHSIARYLSISEGRSRVSGHHYFRDNIPLWQFDDRNSAIYTECSVLKPVIASAAKAKTAALFANAKKGVTIRKHGHKNVAARTN